jgi:dephospho-CoA kinase
MGKTTIAQMLKYLKIPVHDSDQIVKLLLDENVIIRGAGAPPPKKKSRGADAVLRKGEGAVIR